VDDRDKTQDAQSKIDPPPPPIPSAFILSENSFFGRVYRLGEIGVPLANLRK
jgi:hypothetical protein